MSHINQYGRQVIDQSDIDAVVSVLQSDFLTQGNAVQNFERKLSKVLGVQYAIACSSGTAGLHLAMLALEISDNDCVWTTPITFVASANAARYVGANVDLVDISHDSWNLDPNKLEEKLIKTKKNGNSLPKALVVVHFAGCPADLGAIQALSKAWGFYVIEDACHALGATTSNERIGSCKFSDIAVFSFHPVKNITSGEGGAVTTNNKNIFKKICSLRTHGIERPPTEKEQPTETPWVYYQNYLGYNYRMSDIQAALGANQLDRLDQFMSKRATLVELYSETLADHRNVTTQHRGDAVSANHLMVIRIPANKRLKMFNTLKMNNIGTQIHYIPIYKHPYYSDLIDPTEHPEAEKYYQETITLPLHCNLEAHDVNRVCAIVLEELNNV